MLLLELVRFRTWPVLDSKVELAITLLLAEERKKPMPLPDDLMVELLKVLPVELPSITTPDPEEAVIETFENLLLAAALVR